MLNVVCINAGNYQGRGVEYVNNLYRMVQKHLTVPHRFICFDDRKRRIIGFVEVEERDYDKGIEFCGLPDPSFKRWWHKISLFKSRLFEQGDRILYFDLSTVIMANIDDFARYDGPFCMTQAFGGDGPYSGLQSNVMAWQAGFGKTIYQAFAHVVNIEGISAFDNYPGGDQKYIEDAFYAAQRGLGVPENALNAPPTWNEFCPDKIASYKWDLCGTYNGKASVICFHGQPKPHEVGGWAYAAWSGKKESLPAANFQLTYWNEGAKMPLIVPFQAECNTSDEVLAANIRENSRKTDKWVFYTEAWQTPSVLCGSGPSLKRSLPMIAARQKSGYHIFALNGAAKYLNDNGITPDFQIISDAQEATSDLVGPAKEHLFASQVHPATFAKAPDCTLFHVEMGNTQSHLPDHPKMEHVPIMAGWAATGNTALVLAWAMGYRNIHIYGYDSSHENGEGHPFEQPMNNGEPCINYVFNGKQYYTSIVMKMQAERFQWIARPLQELGCDIQVHGDGLLPDMWRAPVEALTEEEKYERVWAYPAYRRYSPGENAVDEFLKIVKPEEGSRVIDFGSGTGRASLKMLECKLDPVLVDFASNSRDPAAYTLPFFKLDLTKPIPITAPYGFCADVMEHIPTEDVTIVIENIMKSAKKAFFQISTVPDKAGSLINEPLHLTVRPHGWWLDLFQKHGEFSVEFDREGEISSQFVITRKD